MSGLLANLVGAATAALNLRTQDPATRGAREPGSDNGFASALSAALAPRERDDASARAEASARADAADAADAAEEAMEAELAETDRAERAREAREARESRASETTVEAAGADEAAPGQELDDPTPVRAANRARNSLEGLNGEFRDRLERVIQRMEKEYGHSVQVVETVRDQARQDHLFAQGRTRPGAVVTWTRNSNHLTGRAADLMVDGTYDNPLAMVRLARIAREEGLKTLGARDPGHIELPRAVQVESVAVSREGSSALLDATALNAGEAARSVAATETAFSGGVARVARVATVAQVAQVATLARVAMPGAAGVGAVDAPAPQVAPEQPAGLFAGQFGGAEGHSAGHDHGRDRQSGGELAAEVLDGAARSGPPAGSGFEPRGAALPGIEVRGVQASFGAEAAERIARVLQLQDTSSSRPLSQVVLRLDNPMGGEDRIRVDLRGTSVGASLSVNDPITAARLQSELGQLQKALEGRGLQAEHLSVSGAMAGRELAEAVRAALPGDAGQRLSQDAWSQRDGSGSRQGGRQSGSDSDQPRQHPRRNTKQERNS